MKITFLVKGKYSQHVKRIVGLGKVVTISATSQLVVHLVNIICGIFIVRVLPSQEYAYYILTSTILSTINLLSDGGISSSVMGLGGKIWNNKSSLGALLHTGLELRRILAVISLTLSIPALVAILYHHDADWLAIILLVGSMIPSFLSALSSTLLEIIPKLHQDIKSLSKIQVTVSLVRLVGVSILGVLPLSFVAILINGLPQLLGNFQLKKLCSKYVVQTKLINEFFKKEILRTIKRLLPGLVYFCFYGQITMWIISFFGSTKMIAELGALSRLTLIFNFFTVVISTVILPRFAKLPDISNVLFSRYLGIHFIVFAICGLIMICAWIFPNEILFVLGSKYSGLKFELLLCILGAALGFISAVSILLSTNRGWVINPILSISVSLVTAATFAFYLDLGDLAGVLKFSIFTNIIQVLMHFLYGVSRILKIKNGVQNILYRG